MSRRDEKGFLWDIIAHGRLALEFMGDASLDQYERERMLRSAVERQVAIVGEGYGGLDAIRPDLADRLQIGACRGGDSKRVDSRLR